MRKLISLALAFAAALAPAAAADWTLAAAESRVSFVSVKAGEIAENHHFKTISGTIAEDGAAAVAIDLASVETGIAIRNERMRERFFETERFPEAVFSAQLAPDDFETMEVGARKRVALEASLSLHGVAAPVSASLFVTRIAQDRFSVTTADPIIINAGQFALSDGLATLRDIAGLPSITPAVPVSASLIFEAASTP